MMKSFEQRVDDVLQEYPDLEDLKKPLMQLYLDIKSADLKSNITSIIGVENEGVVVTINKEHNNVYYQVMIFLYMYHNDVRLAVPDPLLGYMVSKNMDGKIIENADLTMLEVREKMQSLFGIFNAGPS